MNALFALTKADGAHTVVQEAHAPISISSVDIERITAVFAKRFGRAATVRVEKVWAFCDFPHAIIASAAVQGIQATTAHGPYDEAAHIEKTLFHQVAFGLIQAKTLDQDMP